MISCMSDLLRTNTMEVRSLTSALSGPDDFNALKLILNNFEQDRWKVQKLDLDLERRERSSGRVGFTIFRILTSILIIEVDHMVE